MNEPRQPPGAPSWVTSLGALAAIGLAAFSYASSQGEQREAQRRSELAEQRIEQRFADSVKRLWDTQQDLRHELKDDMRHEADLACSKAHGGACDR